MADFACYDPATGAPSTSYPAPGERLAPAGGQLNPAEESYEVGDDAPSTGPVPFNIVPGPLSASKGL